MRIHYFLGLVLCNLFWSAHPLMGKWLLQDFTPLQGVWLRYFSAFLGYVAFWPLIKKWVLPKGSALPLFSLPVAHFDKALVILLGFMAFCLGPFVQMTGLSRSMANENALIVAVEPLMTAVLAWLLLKEKIKSHDALGFCVALFGFALVAGLPAMGFNVDLNMNWDSRLVGNILILVSLVGEASFSILGRKLTQRYSPISIFGTSLGVGVLLLTFAILGIHADLNIFGSILTRLSWKSLFAVIWIGPLGTAAAYLFTLFALSEIPVVSMTLLLFLQPLAGVLLSYLFFDEKLTITQITGSMMILLAVFISNAWRLKKRSSD